LVMYCNFGISGNVTPDLLLPKECLRLPSEGPEVSPVDEL